MHRGQSNLSLTARLFVCLCWLADTPMIRALCVVCCCCCV